MNMEVFTRYLRQYPKKIKSLMNGEVVEVMGKHYSRCFDCDSIVRVDKPIFGSFHVCKDNEEIV